jgi:putative autotransporter adhesin-like protein
MRGRLAAWSVVITILVACGGSEPITGSPNTVTTTVPLTSFSAIQASASFEVNVTIGPSPQVVLRVNENLRNRVDVSVRDGTLRLGLKPGTSVQGAMFQAEVTAPELTRVEAAGAAHVHFLGTLTGQDLELAISGASGFDGTLSGGSVTADLSGASLLILAGSVQGLQVTASGASQVNAGQLAIGDLTVELSGTSQGVVGETKVISAQLSGASVLVYQGTPSFTKKEVSGDSTIEQA